MNDEKLKTYHHFYVDLWRFFKEHADQTINERTVWNFIRAANELKAKHYMIQYQAWIVDDVVRQILEINEIEERDKRTIRQRLDAFFEYAKEITPARWDGNALVIYGGWLGALEPSDYDYMLDGLTKLLCDSGRHISREELEDYIEAGWMLR